MRFSIDSCGKHVTIKVVLAADTDGRLIPVAATVCPLAFLSLLFSLLKKKKAPSSRSETLVQLNPPLVDVQDIVEYAQSLGDLSIIVRETKARLRSRNMNLNLLQTDLSSRSMVQGSVW